MKYSILLVLFPVLCLSGFKAGAQSEQEKLDLPGDNLNLYSVLKLFQESETLEGFEKNLNDETFKINNLDLDGDNNIDYIRVIDKPDGDIHNIALKIAVSKDEDQDVAVFVVKKEKDGGVQIQVIGDEDLYGKDYIIEPNFETAADNSGGTPNPGYTGNPNSGYDNTVEVQNTTFSEVSAWPVISFIYVPTYLNWQSPWYWNNYPSYWHPWRPSYWHYYYGYHYHWNYYYNGHYRRWHNYRIPGWHENYYGGGSRSTSGFVKARYNEGEYKKTYTKPGHAKKGSAEFRRNFPEAPTADQRLPSFDKTGRPIVIRPATRNPVTRPVPTNPATSPVATKPDANEPVITKKLPATKTVDRKPDVTEPIIKTKPPATKTINTRPPVTRPAAPGPATEPVNRPVTPKPDVNRPVNRPPATRPGGSKPANE